MADRASLAPMAKLSSSPSLWPAKKSKPTSSRTRAVSPLLSSVPFWSPALRAPNHLAPTLGNVAAATISTPRMRPRLKSSSPSYASRSSVPAFKTFLTSFPSPPTPWVTATASAFTSRKLRLLSVTNSANRTPTFPSNPVPLPRRRSSVPSKSSVAKVQVWGSPHF
jgi:hypothetical protein